MLYRSVDAFGNPLTDTQTAPGLIDKKYKNQTLSTVRTSTVLEPKDGGTNAEIRALKARIALLEGRLDAIEAVTRNATVTETVTRNVTERDDIVMQRDAKTLAAERAKRYRERKRSNNE